MKKFVINLARRTDRKQKFLETNPNLEVTFVNAIDGQELVYQKLLQMGFDTAKEWRGRYNNRKMTKGEVGCFISHAQLWKHCIDLNEPIIIFEDDAIINNTWDEEYYESLIQKYNFVYLAHSENEDGAQSVDDKLVIPDYPYNLHAYIVTPEAAQILLSTDVIRNIIPADDYVALMLQDLNPVALKQDAANQHSRNELGTDVEQVNEDDFFIDFGIHALTVGTDRKRCVAVNDSSMLNNISVKNLGTGVEWFNDMSGPAGGKKINLLKEYIKNIPDHDVVLFTDAYDVFYADSLFNIIGRYLGFKKQAVFSAERYCYPDNSLANRYPESHTPYRFLNSGTFIATVGSLKKMLNKDVLDSDDDQLYYTKEFLSGKHDMVLDVEHYIFVTHEEQVSKVGEQLYNPLTNSHGCIYHGNGGSESKQKFDTLYQEFYPKGPEIFIPKFRLFDVIDTDMLIVNFMTQSQCEDMIDIADKHGGWTPHPDDKFPAQEIRLKELGLWDECEKTWKNYLYPIIEEYWRPIEMYGLRSAFVMRYAMDTQTSLAYHHDASLVTGSVKLNDDYEGADLVFHRQGISNKDIAVGRCILFPGQVTHGHECMPLKSGVKYSLTMWSQRYEGDILD